MGMENMSEIIVDLKKYNKENLVLTYEKGMVVYVNKKRFVENGQISSNDEVKVNVLNVKPKRNIKIDTSLDKLEAYLSIDYTDGYIYKVLEQFDLGILTLKYEKQSIKANKYTEKDIEDTLKALNINREFKVDNLKEILAQDTVKKILCAKGKKPINDKEDKIEVLFNKTEVLDKNRKIDYRDINKITMIKKGEPLGVIIRGEVGENGLDIFKEPILKKDKGKLPIFLKENCVLVDDKIIATIDGKPEFKNNTFNVIQLLQVNQNVNMESGNVNFIGDVHINGNIEVGMTVTSGDSIFIEGNIESCNIKARRKAILKGKTILSTVLVGVDDKEILKYSSNIKELIESLEKIKEFSKILMAKGDGHEYGKIIKVIIDNKFKDINKIIFGVLSYKKNNRETLDLITKKLIGLGPLSIKSFDELNEIIENIKTQEEKCRETLKEKGELVLEYIQDSEINCTGDVYLSGKGSFISKIVSGGKVEFLNEDSVLRGGEINAKESIRGYTVGSLGGAKTILKVQEAGGEIAFSKVYRNTVLCFGKLTRTIEEDSKDLKAYVESGELKIEKLAL